MAGQIALPGNLTGNFHVRVGRTALQDAHRILPLMRHRAILQRHALKLRYWPENHPLDESGNVLDLDWSWINACKPSKIGELRIGERIGDCDNLRLIFFDPQIREPHPTLWILAAMQKKRNEFTTANIKTFHARKQLILDRFYDA